MPKKKKKLTVQLRLLGPLTVRSLLEIGLVDLVGVLAANESHGRAIAVVAIRCVEYRPRIMTATDVAPDHISHGNRYMRW
jgi:hypothetical protein